MVKTLRLLIVLFLLLGLTVSSFATTQAAQPAQGDPLVISILKLVLPLGQTLLDKIFPAGSQDKDKKTKGQVRGALDEVTKELQKRQGDLNDSVGALNEWRMQRIALPLCNLYAAYIQEDLQIAAQSDYDNSVLEQIWPILQKNIGLLKDNVPVPSSAKTQSGSAEVVEAAKLDDLILSLKGNVGDLVRLSNENDKVNSIKNMKAVAETIMDSLRKSGTEANLVMALVVNEYSGFSKAIAATTKDQLASASAEMPHVGGQEPSPISGYLWAQEPGDVFTDGVTDFSTAREAEGKLREAESDRQRDRARILIAIRATGPEHALPYSMLGYLAGLAGAALGIFGRDPILHIIRGMTESEPKPPLPTA